MCKLKKAMYGLKQSPLAWFDKFSGVIGTFDFRRCYSNHSNFIQCGPSGTVVLAIHVDNILLTGSDIGGIREIKQYLKQKFVTKDIGKPKYFLGIEIAHGKHRVILSQRKCALDLLDETSVLGCNLASTLIGTDKDFWFETRVI